jgi:hypothetical protein
VLTFRTAAVGALEWRHAAGSGVADPGISASGIRGLERLERRYPSSGPGSTSISVRLRTLAVGGRIMSDPGVEAGPAAVRKDQGRWNELLGPGRYGL